MKINPRTIIIHIATLIIGLYLCLPAQVKSKVSIIGGDDKPILKHSIEISLEAILLEMNKVDKKMGDLQLLSPFFTREAFNTFQAYVTQNKPYTARKAYAPQMIERMNGEQYDIRSIAVKIELGGTEASDNQNLIFSFSKDGKVSCVRSILPQYDFQKVISSGKNEQDSLIRGMILDFMEQFRTAYNTRDLKYLEKVYSDDALILVGTVLEEKKGSDDMLKKSYLSAAKVKLIQQTKRQYLDGLKSIAFKRNSFINVRFDDLSIVQHEKIAALYGISCWQQWNSSTYSDRGYLFLMMDFRNPKEPVIHVRAWQPKAFDEDSSYVSLYDFDVMEY